MKASGWNKYYILWETKDEEEPTLVYPFWGNEIARISWSTNLVHTLAALNETSTLWQHFFPLLLLNVNFSNAFWVSSMKIQSTIPLTGVTRSDDRELGRVKLPLLSRIPEMDTWREVVSARMALIVSETDSIDQMPCARKIHVWSDNDKARSNIYHSILCCMLAPPK